MDACCITGPTRSRSPVFVLAVVAIASILIGGAAPTALFAQETPDSTLSAFRATDLLRMQRIETVRVSPDGRYVAYTVHRTAAANPNEALSSDASRERHLYLASVSGRRPPQALTRSEPAHSPAWHPNGDRIAFVRPVDGTPQVFILSLTGGEPVQVTNTPHGAVQPSWSPSGDRILFASDLPARTVRARTGRAGPGERPGRMPADTAWTPPIDTLVVLRDTTTFSPVDTASVALGDSLLALSDSLGAVRDTITVEGASQPAASPDGSLSQVRRWLDRSAESPQVHTRLELHGPDGAAGTTYRHFFAVPVPDGLVGGTAARPVPYAVTSGFRTFADAAWLPGGGQVVVSGSPPSDRHIDRVQRRDLYLADARPPAPTAGPVPTRIRRLLRLENHALISPRVTSDGTTVAFRARDLRAGAYAQHEIGLFALDGRTKPQIVTGPFDRDPGPIQWSPDGWYLYTTAPSDGGTALYRFAPFGRSDSTDAPTPPPIEGQASEEAFALDTSMTRRVPYEQLTDAPQTVLGVDATDATVVYAAAGPDTPSELYANTVQFGRERRLSRHNADWLADRRLADAERISVLRDSIRGDAWLVRPAASSSTARHPLAVVLPGGPGTMSSPGAPATWPLVQMLAARGFAVALANPRGAAGYGRAVRTAAYRNWGAGPAGDVLAAADAADDRAWVDSTRQVLIGSGGGATLAAWIAGHSDRFRAVVAENGAYDLPALLGSRAWPLLPGHFGGYPWSGPATRDSARVPRWAAMGRIAPPSDTSGSPASMSALPAVEADSAATDTVGARAAMQAASPLAYVDSIRTPLLLMGPEAGAGGLSPAASQVERLYKSLKILGRPVEYVRYPDPASVLGAVVTPAARRYGLDTAAPASRPSARLQVDRLLRIYEFAARYACSAECGPASVRNAKFEMRNEE